MVTTPVWQLRHARRARVRRRGAVAGGAARRGRRRRWSPAVKVAGLLLRVARVASAGGGAAHLVRLVAGGARHRLAAEGAGVVRARRRAATPPSASRAAAPWKVSWPSWHSVHLRGSVQGSWWGRWQLEQAWLGVDADGGLVALILGVALACTPTRSCGWPCRRSRSGSWQLRQCIEPISVMVTRTSSWHSAQTRSSGSPKPFTSPRWQHLQVARSASRACTSWPSRIAVSRHLAWPRCSAVWQLRAADGARARGAPGRRAGRGPRARRRRSGVARPRAQTRGRARRRRDPQAAAQRRGAPTRSAHASRRASAWPARLTCAPRGTCGRAGRSWAASGC